MLAFDVYECKSCGYTNLYCNICLKIVSFDDDYIYIDYEAIDHIFGIHSPIELYSSDIRIRFNTIGFYETCLLSSVTDLIPHLCYLYSPDLIMLENDACYPNKNFMRFPNGDINIFDETPYRLIDFLRLNTFECILCLTNNNGARFESLPCIELYKAHFIKYHGELYSKNTGDLASRVRIFDPHGAAS